ncbi:MAG: hypothetical protein K2W95_26600 [Candidatus Obscuribacterales bacterium]|nr:hypothetical protein [Candidatus Obscuribacterales bacterium]
MKVRIGIISAVLLLGMSVAPVNATVAPEGNVDKAASTLALLPGLCRPSAPQAPQVDGECVSAVMMTRVTGDVTWSGAAAVNAASVNSTLPERVTVKTGKSSWCEVQVGKILVRCWHNTECVIDSANQAVHLKNGSVIVRKGGAGEMLLTAGGQTLLLESGVARVEVANGVARILN